MLSTDRADQDKGELTARCPSPRSLMTPRRRMMGYTFWTRYPQVLMVATSLSLQVPGVIPGIVRKSM